jgi:hypothetical protein
MLNFVVMAAADDARVRRRSAAVAALRHAMVAEVGANAWGKAVRQW